MKKLIRLTEQELYGIIKESANKILKEARKSQRDKWEFKGLSTRDRILKKIEFGRYDDLLGRGKRYLGKILSQYNTLPKDDLEAIKEALTKRMEWLFNLSDEESEEMRKASAFLDSLKEGFYDRNIAEEGEAFVQKAIEKYPNHPEIESYIRYKLPGLMKRASRGEKIRNVVGIRYANINAYTRPFSPWFQKEVRREGDPEFEEYNYDKY